MDRSWPKPEPTSWRGWHPLGLDQTVCLRRPPLLPLDRLASPGLLRSAVEKWEVSVAREQRKLAAILAADVVGYSRLMGRDESGTLARLRYELWGDTVNVASRMEGASMPGGILVTRDVQRQLKHDFEFKTFEIREIKGKGKMETWLLGGLKQ